MNFLAVCRFIIPILVLLGFLDKYFLGKTYIFSPENLQQICKASISKYGNQTETETLMKDIVDSLKQEYGEAILPYDGSKWVLNNAGGAMVLKNSITFGTKSYREQC